MKRSILVAILIFALSHQSYASGDGYFYVVEPKNSVSRILQRARLVPIYGKNGTLHAVEGDNSYWLKDIDKIRPGQKIYFSKELALRAESSGYVKISSSGQITWTNKIKNLNEGVGRRVAQESVPGSTLTSAATTKSVIATTQASEVVAPGVSQAQEKSVVAPKAEEKATSSLGFKMGYQYARLDAEDISTKGKTTFLSNLNPQYEVLWGLDWHSKWVTEIGFTDETLDFQPDANQNKTYLIPKKHLNEIYLRAKYQHSETVTSTMMFTRGATVSPRAVTVTELSLDQIDTNKFSLGCDWAFVKHKGVDFGLDVMGGYIINAGSSTYKVKPGWDAEMQLYMRHNMTSRGLALTGGVFYRHLKQDSDYAIQSENTVGATFGLIKSFGE